MKFIALTLLSLAAFARAAPLVTVRLFSPSILPLPANTFFFLFSQRDNIITSRDAFEQATPQQRTEFLMAINPQDIHTSPEIRAQIEQVPQVAEKLGGRALTDDMIRSWLADWQKRHESKPAQA
ncbi:hypothetical protein R3P38DRAFT_2866122 [Favolaschia claudopus]|uniref:Uncharacterized protein n=1 Tax=Favolaschia claudopus TaxID=2862362 RepID=A0AAW0DH72_9AGAR